MRNSNPRDLNRAQWLKLKISNPCSTRMTSLEPNSWWTCWMTARRAILWICARQMRSRSRWRLGNSVRPSQKLKLLSEEYIQFHWASLWSQAYRHHLSKVQGMSKARRELGRVKYWHHNWTLYLLFGQAFTANLALSHQKQTVFVDLRQSLLLYSLRTGLLKH